MIRGAGRVVARRGVSAEVRIWKNGPQNTHGRGERTYDHRRNTPDHDSQTFEPA